MTTGKEFLNDIKFTLTHALYREGHQIDKADGLAESIKQAIFEKFKGSTLYIPNLRSVAADSREKVLALFEEGKKPAEIIRLTGLSNCTVYTYIRNRNRPDNRHKRNDLAGMKDILAMKLFAAKLLLEAGIDQDSCKAVSEGLQTFIIKQWGGVCFSIPRPVNVTVGGTSRVMVLKERNDLIYEEYSQGSTPKELAEKYSLGKSCIRSLLRDRKRKTEQS